MDFGKQVRLSTLVAGKGPAVEVTTHATVQEVADLLAAKRLLAVPVWDEDRRRYVAFVDVLDLLAHTALICHVRDRRAETLEDFDVAAFGYGTVMDLLQPNRPHKVHVFGPSATLENLMKLLHHQEEHRVLVAVVGGALLAG